MASSIGNSQNPIQTLRKSQTLKSTEKTALILLIWQLGLSTSLTCTDPTCTCSLTFDQWYITCMETLEHDVYFYYDPDRYSIKIQCNGRPSSNMSAYFERLGIIDEINVVTFEDCPMPDTPFADYLRGINLTELYFTSAANRPLRSTTSDQFSGLKSLKSLGLDGNGFLEVPEDLLINTPELVFVDLKRNQLDHVPSNFFNHTPRLTTIVLAANHLRVLLEPLGDLPRLTTLHLHHNELSNISRQAFSGLSALIYLDLQGNDLSHLSPDVFTDLTHLRELRLFSNLFHQLPEGLLRHNSELQFLDLHDNPMSELPENLIIDHLHLRFINLTRCNLSSLPQSFFRGVTNLTDINLSFNEIESLNETLFNDVINLITLKLDHNQLATLPQKIFYYQTKLINLHLNHNFLTNLHNRTFANSDSLRVLDLSNNFLTELDSPFSGTDGLELFSLYLNNNNITLISRDAFIPCGYLNYLDLSHNVIDVVDFQLPQRLVHFNISHNSLREMPPTWAQWMNNLINLNLSYNYIEIISAPNLQFYSGDAVIDLRHNSIRTVDLRLDEFLTGDETSGKPIARLGFNPVHCDCKTIFLLTHMKYQSQEQRVTFRLDVENLKCSEPPSLKGRQVSMLTKSDLYCTITKDCPKNCTCVLRTKGYVTEVTCPPKSLNVIPSVVPHNTSVLNLTGNNITSLTDLRNPRWINLTTLILTDNLMTSLDVASLPPNLQKLYLNKNRLQRIELSTLEALTIRHQLRLWFGGNPWICDCDHHIEPWLESTPNVMDSYLMECVNLPNTTVGRYECHKTSWDVMIGVIIASIVLMIIVSFLGIAYYKYLHEVRVWLYARGWCLWVLSEKDVDADKQFDAFISFSQDDVEWVARELLPGLEHHEPYYQVCVHHRDWLVGEWIPDQIVRSVEESCRTIVVLSSNFLQSVWGRLEFKTAHHQALKDRMNRVIVIVLGDVPPKEEMDPEMRMYVGLNTYLKWEDPWFWKKLRYAMPHKPVSSSSSGQNSRISVSSPSCISDHSKMLKTTVSVSSNHHQSPMSPMFTTV